MEQPSNVPVTAISMKYARGFSGEQIHYSSCKKWTHEHWAEVKSDGKCIIFNGMYF